MDRKRPGQRPGPGPLPESLPGGRVQASDRRSGDRHRLEPDAPARNRAGSHEVETPFMEQNLARTLRALVRDERSTGRGIERRDRGRAAQRHIDPVADRYQTPRNLRGALVEPSGVCVPPGNGTPPEQNAAECITGDQGPLGRQIDRRRGSLVHDVEHTPRRGDHTAHAGVLVAARVQRSREPLRMVWRRHNRIPRDGVVAGVVERVGPLVDRVQARFLRDRPRVPLARAECTAWREDAHHVIRRYAPNLSAHEQIDQIVHVGQGWPAPTLGRDLAVEPRVPDALTGPLDICRVAV